MPPVVVDDIKCFHDGRLICLHEDAWRIHNFSIHKCHPLFQVLVIHLEGICNVPFLKKNTHLSSVIDILGFGFTTLT